jgi:TonB-dependent receptor
MGDVPASTALYGFTDFFRNQANQPPAAYFIRSDILSDHDKLMDLLRNVTTRGGGNYVPIEDRGCATVKGFFCPNEVYRNDEKTLAAYARLDFGTEIGGLKLTGNIGVRYVRTQDDSVGALTFPTSNQVYNQSAPTDPATGQPAYTNLAGYCAYSASHRQPNEPVPVICTLTASQQAAVLAFANGASVPDTAHQKYGNWLPSLNLKLQLTSNLLMRFAASKALSRPNFGSLRNYAGVGVSPANSAGSFGFSARAQNPYLRPVEATQLDLTAEWYFAKVGSLTGALFYKDLSHIILENSGFSRTLANNGQAFTVDFTGPANVGGHGKIKGAELAYQQTYDFLPGKLRGLGLQATFTYVEPSHIPNAPPDFRAGSGDGNQPPLDVSGINATLPLAGLSKYNANAALFYDLDGVYARVAYSWRSKFLLTNRDCCFPFLPVYSLASGQLDASLFYNIDKHFKIGVEAQNLLDTTTRTTFVLNKEGLEAPRSYFKSDRQFVVTARMTF